MFKGNLTHLVKKVPFASIKFYSYERYKQVHSINWFNKQVLTPGNKEEANPILRFTSGALAAVTACVVTYPLDMVQTQLATQTLQKKYTGKWRFHFPHEKVS